MRCDGTGRALGVGRAGTYLHVYGNEMEWLRACAYFAYGSMRSCIISLACILYILAYLEF